MTSTQYKLRKHADQIGDTVKFLEYFVNFMYFFGDVPVGVAV